MKTGTAVLLALLVSLALFIGLRRTSSPGFVGAPDSALSANQAPSASPASAASNEPEVGTERQQAADSPAVAMAGPLSPMRPLRDRFELKRTVYRSDSALTEGAVQRVEILETGFHHPLIRLVSRVTRDPVTSREQVVEASAMVADHVVVKPASGVRPADIVSRFPGAQLSIRRSATDSIVLLAFPVSETTGDRLPDIIALLGTAPDIVAIVEPDLIFSSQDLTPNEEAYTSGRLWGYHNTGQRGERDVNGVADQDIDAPEGWAIRTDASSVVVAIIDSGVRLTHEDLAGNLWTNPGESGNGRETNGVDDDGNGYVDDVHGANVQTVTGDPSDDFGHGTHVAGTVGATGNNGVGAVGVAWKARLMAVKMLDRNGVGSLSDAVAGFDYARRNGAHIVNASWGGLGEPVLLRDAIQAYGTIGGVVVCAAGNANKDTTLTPFSPACYDFPFLVSVAAMSRYGTLSYFSNWGGTHIAAPGEEIYSTWHESDSSYRELMGTSMASPHVTGVVALLRAQAPTDDAEKIVHRLISGAVESDILPYQVVLPNPERPMLYRRVLNLHRPLANPTPPPVPRISSGVFRVKHEMGQTFELKVQSIEADGPVTFQWLQNDKPVEGATSQVLTISNAQRTQGGKYNLAVTNAAGTAYSRSILLSVVGPPAVVTQPTASIVVEGNRVVFAVAILGNGYDRIAYQWSRNGVALPGATHATLNIERATTADAGAYRVTASNEYGSVDSDAVPLTVLRAQAPQVTTQPSNISVRADQEAAFSVAVAGTPVLSYQWRHNGVDLPGEVEATLRIPRAQVSDAGEYSVVVTNSGGSATSASARLTVASAPVAPFIVRQPFGRDVRLGEGFTLSVTAKGTPTPTLQWRLNGAPIAGATQASYSVPRAQHAHVGDYSVVATNASGSVTSDAATITMRNAQGASNWAWRAPLPHGGTLTDITFAHDRFVAVGYRGTILTSPDTLVWTRRPTGSMRNLTAICKGPNRTLVAVGDAGTVIVSDDGGVTWNGVKPPTTANLQAIVYGNGRYIALCASPMALLTSPDARNWTPLPTPQGQRWITSFIFGQGHFYMVTDDGYFGVMTDAPVSRSTDGVTWEAVDLGLKGETRISHGNGVFVATVRRPEAAHSLTSTDGKTWVRRRVDWAGSTSIRHVGNLFISTGVLGSILTSPDGTDWTEHPQPTSSPFGTYAYGAGYYVQVGPGGAIATSPDTIAWTQRTAPSTTALTAITYGPAGFVAFGTNKALFSNSGVLWSEQTGIREGISRARYENGRYVAVGKTSISESTDGLTWTVTPMKGLKTGAIISNMARAGDRRVAVGSTLVNLSPPKYGSYVTTSTDGENWTECTTPDVEAVDDVLHDGTRFVAIGTTGLLTSTDGISWTAIRPESIATGSLIAFDGRRYVAAVSNRRALFYSDDLSSWTETSLPADIASNTTVGFEALTFAAGQFIALQADGTLLSSVDGAKWMESDSGGQLGMTAIAYGRNTLVAVGFGGAILQSGPLVNSYESLLPSPAQQLCAAGGTATLEIDAVGTEGVALQWQKDGVDIPGATGSTLSISGAQASDAGAYSVRIRTGIDLAVTQSAFLGIAEVGTVPVEAGTCTIKVTAPSGMAWSITSIAPWLRLSGVTRGSGSGQILFAVQGNYTDQSRTAAFVISGTPFTITQPKADVPAPAPISRLINLSTRGRVGPGAETMVAGFVVTGPEPSRVLLRAGGPVLASFGVSGVLPNPTLSLYDGNGTLIRQNDDWNRGSDANGIFRWTMACGAFPFPVYGQDAAILTTLAPGRYTVHVTGIGDSPSGVALVEAYEARYEDESPGKRRLVNISTRAPVGAGDAALIAGFVVAEGPDRWFVIRGLGPVLASFGVEGVLANPRLELFKRGSDTPIGSNDDWGTISMPLALAMKAAGAFDLPLGSADAAMAIRLSPGLYTAKVAGVGDSTGIGMIEVYEIPEGAFPR